MRPRKKIIHTQVHRTNLLPGEAVSYQVILISHMPNVCCKLRNGRQVTLLRCSPQLRRFGPGKGKGFMVHKGGEVVQQEPEVPCGEEKRQKLPVKCGVLLSLSQSFLLKKTRGCQAPSTHCSHTTLTAKSEVSVVRACGCVHESSFGTRGGPGNQWLATDT